MIKTILLLASLILALMFVSSSNNALPTKLLEPYQWMHIALDECTPFSQHTNDNATGGLSVMRCAHALGLMKHVCDTQDFLKAKWCIDQRYTTWLMNEYVAYPNTTWRFIDITGKLIIP